MPLIILKLRMELLSIKLNNNIKRPQKEKELKPINRNE
jgi:hypothetical protein